MLKSGVTYCIISVSPENSACLSFITFEYQGFLRYIFSMVQHCLLPFCLSVLLSEVTSLSCLLLWEIDIMYLWLSLLTLFWLITLSPLQLDVTLKHVYFHLQPNFTYIVWDWKCVLKVCMYSSYWNWRCASCLRSSQFTQTLKVFGCNFFPEQPCCWIKSLLQCRCDNTLTPVYVKSSRHEYHFFSKEHVSLVIMKL